MKRLTKKAMVKDIFFIATCGDRSANNWVEGMSVMEDVANHNYWETIKRAWDELATSDASRATARAIMRRLMDFTFVNLSGAAGPGERANAFRRDARVFNL